MKLFTSIAIFLIVSLWGLGASATLECKNLISSIQDIDKNLMGKSPDLPADDPNNLN